MMLSVKEINMLVKENAELKAENKRLKAEFRIESLTDKTTGETIYRSNLVNKYRTTLQEIMVIEEYVIDNDNSLKTDHCFGYCGECSTFDHCKLYPYWQIIHLITKAEEE